MNGASWSLPLLRRAIIRRSLVSCFCSRQFLRLRPVCGRVHLRASRGGGRVHCRFAGGGRRGQAAAGNHVDRHRGRLHLRLQLQRLRARQEDYREDAAGRGRDVARLPRRSGVRRFGQRGRLSVRAHGRYVDRCPRAVAPPPPPPVVKAV